MSEKRQTITHHCDDWQKVLDTMVSLNALHREFRLTMRVRDRPHDPYFASHLISDGKYHAWTIEEFVS